MRRSSPQCRVSHILFTGNAYLNTVSLALLLVSSLVCVSSFTLGSASGDDRDVHSLEDLDPEGLEDSSLGEIKLASTGQQQLLSQLKNELGIDEADVSMLERQHGLSDDENALLRDAVPGLNENVDNDAERDSASNEASENASGSAEDGSASFAEASSAEDPDNSEEEGDGELDDSDDNAAAGSFDTEDDRDQESDSSDASESASFVEEDDAAPDESLDETDEGEVAHVTDPYDDPLSHLDLTADKDFEYEEEPSSFIQVGMTDQLIKKHEQKARYLAQEIPAPAFSQDRVKLLADQTPVEEELLNEASDVEGGQDVVSPTDDGAGEGDSSAAEADNSAAVIEQASMGGNMEEPVGLGGEAEIPEESLSRQEAQTLKENMSAGDVAEDNAGPSAMDAEKAPNSLDGVAPEVAPARAPEAETVEGTAAQIVQEMREQDQGVEESRPQEVLKRHTWQDMETQQDLRTRGETSSEPSGQTAVAVASFVLITLSVGCQFVLSV